MRISDWSSDVCSSDLLPFSQKGFPANDDDGEAIWRQRLVEMLADSGGLVGFRKIFAGIAHLLDDPGDIGIAIAVMLMGCLAQEIRRGRTARRRADGRIEAGTGERRGGEGGGEGWR